MQKLNLKIAVLILVTLAGLNQSIKSQSFDEEWVNFAYTQEIKSMTKTESHIWISSSGGVIRLDKNDFERKIFNVANSPLLSNNVGKIFGDSQNRIWISYINSQEIHLLENNTWTLLNYNLLELATGAVNDIDEDSQGNIWFGTINGLLKYSDNNFILYSPDQEFTWNNNIQFISIDANDKVWVAGNSSLNSFSGEEFGEWQDKGVFFTALEAGENGIWYSAHWGFGNGIGLAFQNYGGEEATIWDSANTEIPFDYIEFIEDLGENEIWFGGAQYMNFGESGSLVNFDGINFTSISTLESDQYFAVNSALFFEDYLIYGGYNGVVKFQNNESEFLDIQNNTLSANSIRDMHIDNNNVKWIGTDDGLAKVVDSEWQQINYSDLGIELEDDQLVNHFRNIAQTEDGIIRVSTFDGIWNYDGTDWESDESALNGMPEMSVYGLAAGSNNQLFGAFWTEGVAIRNTDGQWTSTILNDESGFADRIRFIASNPSTDKAWAADFDQLYEYDGSTWAIVSYPSPSMNQEWIRGMQCDDEGNLWLVGSKVISVKSSIDGLWQYFEMPEEAIPNNNNKSGFHIDENGTIWVGTDMSLLKLQDGEWTKIVLDQIELNIPQIGSIDRDSQGNLWVTTRSTSLHLFREGGVVLGLNELEPSTDFGELNVYPNPALNSITLKLPNKDFYQDGIEFFGANGQGINSATIYKQENNSVSYDISTFPSGIFFLSYNDPVSKSKRTFKIQKEN